MHVSVARVIQPVTGTIHRKENVFPVETAGVEMKKRDVNNE